MQMEVTSAMHRNGISPLRDFMSLRDSMDRLFEDRWVSPGSWLTWSSAGATYLPIDLYETADEVVLRAVVAGAAPDGIDIQFQGGVLTLRAKAEEPNIPEGATWLVHEVAPSESIRQITLPRAVDAERASTTFEHGVLTVTLPKSEDAKPKQIRVEPTRQITGGSTVG
jgi:HSP20 family protein